MKYDQIVDYIKKEIQTGGIKSGRKLPSIRDICNLFICSKSTVVRAYDELENQHIVYSVPNSGYYLVEKSFLMAEGGTEEVIDFASAAPDTQLLPYKEFQHCLEQAVDIYKENLFSYTDSQGLKALIKAIVMQLQNYQIFTGTDNVFITTGSQQALDILSRMPFPNGKINIVVEQPTYQGMLKCIELNGIKAIGIRRDLNGLNMDDLERIFKNGNVKFFYTIPRFSNPLGLSYTNEEKKQIAHLAEKYDVYVLEDDYLGDMEYDQKSDPIYSFDESSRVIYLKTFSKILLPGLRIAAVVLPELLVNVFREYKRWADLNTPVLSQGALEIYIKSGMFNNHVKSVKTFYSNRLACLKNVIEAGNFPFIRWNIPKAGFFSGIEILNGTKAIKIKESAAIKNILLAEPEKFYLMDFATDKAFRISIARADEEKINRGVPMILEELCRKNKAYSIFEL